MAAAAAPALSNDPGLDFVVNPLWQVWLGQHDPDMTGRTRRDEEEVLVTCVYPHNAQQTGTTT